MRVAYCDCGGLQSGGAELTERLSRLHLLDRSQEDLDRIQQVWLTESRLVLQLPPLYQS